MDSSLFYQSLGSSVRRAREASNLTQSDLAAIVGVSRTSLTNMELGRQRMLVDQLADIAIALHVSVESLLPSEVSNEDEQGTDDYQSLPAVSKFIRKMRMDDKAA